MRRTLELHIWEEETCCQRYRRQNNTGHQTHSQVWSSVCVCVYLEYISAQTTCLYLTLEDSLSSLVQLIFFFLPLLLSIDAIMWNDHEECVFHEPTKHIHSKLNWMWLDIKIYRWRPSVWRGPSQKTSSKIKDAAGGSITAGAQQNDPQMKSGNLPVSRLPATLMSEEADSYISLRSSHLFIFSLMGSHRQSGTRGAKQSRPLSAD